MACLTNYCIQCIEETTKQRGCFFFDQNHWQETGKFKAIGPVYPDLHAFYNATKPEDRQSIYLERSPNK